MVYPLLTEKKAFERVREGTSQECLGKGILTREEGYGSMCENEPTLNRRFAWEGTPFFFPTGARGTPLSG